MSYAEEDLLAIARALMSPAPDAFVDASLAAGVEVNTISRGAMDVLEDTLAKGAVRMLARLGGAKSTVRADTGSITPQRVTDVRKPPAIHFSRYSFELIRWLTRTPLGAPAAVPFTKVPETNGDQLVAYCTLRLVAGRRFESTVSANPGLAGPLAALGFARALGRYGQDAVMPDFHTYLAAPENRIIVECLAGDLARLWLGSVSWRPNDLLELEVATRIGLRERATIDAFVDACAKIERWDLISFLVDAAFRAMPPSARPETIAQRATAPVRSGGTLRARTEARQRSGALFHSIARIGRKYEELALVRFIDDGYDVAQALLTAWSQLGREGFARAAAVSSELTSLTPFVGAEAQTS